MLAGPLRKSKRGRPSPDLLARIDRSYGRFPWRAGGTYLYRGASRTVVFAVAEVAEVALGRHYVRTATGYRQVPTPVLSQPVCVLLDWDGPDQPEPDALAGLLPKTSLPAPEDRDRIIARIGAWRHNWERVASRSFEQFAVESAKMLGHFSPAQLRDRYQLVTSQARGLVDALVDETAALRTQFSLRFTLDPGDEVPHERLADSGFDNRPALPADIPFVTPPCPKLRWKDLESFGADCEAAAYPR